MKKLLLVAVCVLSTMAVSAQRASSSSSSFFSTEKAETGVQFGIRAGLNFSNISQKYEDDNVLSTFDSRTSFHFGVIADIPLMESLYIQTGLYFQEKGSKSDGVTVNPMYLEIPVLASYRYNFSDAAQLQINFGPYLAYGIGGKFKYEDGDYDIDFFGDGEDENDNAGFKRFDCGLQVGAGITLAKHYYIGVAYEFGLTNISHGDEDGLKTKNKNWMVSVGYTF